MDSREIAESRSVSDRRSTKGDRHSRDFAVESVLDRSDAIHGRASARVGFDAPMRSVLAVLLVLGVACGDVPSGSIEVVATLPHDTAAFTQGLVLHQGILFESTGRYGSSSIRRLDASTGEVLEIQRLGDEDFGEGLALMGDHLLQLTWKERIALRYPVGDLTRPDTLDFESDGWGACFDGESLFTTSGGSVMTRRDPESLQATAQIQVTLDGVPAWQVNELECVGEFIYGNVFQSNSLLKIDKASGQVLAEWDMGPLVPPGLLGSVDAVANGIAHDPDTGLFYLTGKLWPVLYRVRLDEG